VVWRILVHYDGELQCEIFTSMDNC